MSSPPVVHILCRSVGYAYGGVQTAVVHVVDALRAMDVNVELVARRSAETSDVWCEGAPWTWHQRRLKWWTERIAGIPDLAWVITPDPWAVLAVRRSRPKAHIVFTPGELELRSAAQIFTNSNIWWGLRLFEWVTGRVLLTATRSADSTVVQCDQLRQFALRQRGINANTLAVIPYGVANPGAQVPSVGASALRSLIGVDESTPIIAGVGRHVMRKRFDFLIDGFSRMTSSTAHLVLMGDGPETPALKKRASGRHHDRIHFLGARSDVMDLLRECRAMVMSSDYEPFGIVVLEAMAAGCPVITRRPSFPKVVIGAAEYLVDGVDALVVDTFDPSSLAATLDAVCNDPAMLEGIRRTAYQRASYEFTWGRYAERCLGLLRFPSVRPT